MYLTMKSEWASCMMSFSERMCSCCLVSTMCLFFSIFMAKVLFSSLLSWTCNAEESRSACAITCTLREPTVKMSKRNHSCYCHSRVLPYQLDTPEATDTQSVDDVEVSQVEIEEKCVLCFIPVVPGKRGKKRQNGNRIRDEMKDERRDNPLPTTWDKISVSPSAHLFANLRGFDS